MSMVEDFVVERDEVEVMNEDPVAVEEEENTDLLIPSLDEELQEEDQPVAHYALSCMQRLQTRTAHVL